MRKLKLQVQMSVDGFVARENGGLDWMTWDTSADRIKYVNDLTDSSGTILLGRKMTDGFVNYWSGVLDKHESPEYDFAKKMIDIPKVVFTKTLDKSDWVNTILARGPLEEEVKKLKQQSGKDIIVYGGAEFVSNLVKESLIDDYHIFVNPAAIGNGLSIFSKLDRKNFNLLKTIPFEDGVVLLHYEPKK
jgi:dihydrofolate reductase